MTHELENNITRFYNFLFVLGTKNLVNDSLMEEINESLKKEKMHTQAV